MYASEGAVSVPVLLALDLALLILGFTVKSMLDPRSPGAHTHTLSLSLTHCEHASHA